MGKLIKVTDSHIDNCVEEFRKALTGWKMSDGKVTFSKSFDVLDRKAKLYFTELAWVKMQALVVKFDKEVAWHGLAYRCEEKDSYIIKDILVYPQEVTGATVTTDQAEYQNWLMFHEDDVFNNIRMQGHSHVRMSTTPSHTDLSWYDSILEQLNDDMFYIFLIYNKNGDKTIKIYDMRENVLFETSDVTVEVLEEENGLLKFVKNAQSLVKEKSYTAGSGYGTYGKTYGYSYNGKSTSSTSSVTTVTTPASASKSVTVPATEPKKDNKHDDDKKNEKTGKRKGKRKKSEHGGKCDYKYGGYNYYGCDCCSGDFLNDDDYYLNLYGVR